MAILH